MLHSINQTEIHLPKVLLTRPSVTLQKDNILVCYQRPLVEDLLPIIDLTLHTFTDLSNPSPCSKNEQDLELLYTICQKVGLLRELYLEVVTHPKNYFTVSGPVITFSPLQIFECPCSTGSHNRFLNDHREVFENALVQHIQDIVPNKTDSVRILSMGCGGLLQDWEILGLLIEDGYNTFEVTFVDPTLNEKSGNFTDFYKLIGVNLTENFIYSISEVSEFNAHAILAVDFDALFQIEEGTLVPSGDMMHCKKFLDESGMIFLSQLSHGIIVSKTSLTSVFTNESCEMILNDIESIVETYRGPIRIGVLNDQYWPAIQAIGHLRTLGIDSIEIVCIGGDLRHKELFHFIDSKCAIHVRPGSLTTVLEKDGGFDFVFTQHIEHDSLQQIDQIETHIMTKSTSIYFISGSDVSKISLNRTEKFESDIVFI